MKVSYLCANTYGDPQVLSRAKYPAPPQLYDPAVGARSLESAFANAKLADDLGYDWVSVSEHHFAPGIMAPNAAVFAGALSQVVRRAKIAFLGPIVSINNPVRVAEEIALLDMISGGRVVVFLLRGTPEEFRTYYFNPLESRERSHEAIMLIKRALSEPQPFGWEGRYFRYPTVAVWPGSTQSPHPPIFSSGNSPESCVFAARNRFGLAMSFIPPDLVAKSVELYKTECKKAGWEPTQDNIVYRCHTLIGETEEAVERQMPQAHRFDLQQENARGPRGFGPLSWMEHRDVEPNRGQGSRIPAEDGAARAGEGYALGSLLFRGTPDAVVEQIEQFHALTGVGTIDILFSNPGGPEVTANCLRLFAREVLPRIRDLGEPDGVKQPAGVSASVG